MAHKTDEYVYKDYYLAFFDIYKELLLGIDREKVMVSKKVTTEFGGHFFDSPPIQPST